MGGTASMAKLDCQQKCGHMTIPYPFGIGQGCCMEKEFEVTCTNGSWAWLVGELFVLDLSLDYIRVGGGSMAIDCFNDSGTNSIGLNYKLNLRFSFSHTQNKFVAVGCDIFAYIIDPKSANYTSGCVSLCHNDTARPILGLSCSGVGCCQTTIPNDISSFDLQIISMNTFNHSWSSHPCTAAFVAQKDFSSYRRGIEMYPFIPTVLSWSIGNVSCDEA
ncbi:unnamed protein product [Ilex paraguariensis]|uniref:Wall-associated receptor kinase galacturonan-binding domain-containing protein n=1 Tax=Ilex paraguariensis TaxID=185542 RepID=A0ABC8SN10_9AQUA